MLSAATSLSQLGSLPGAGLAVDSPELDEFEPERKDAAQCSEQPGLIEVRIERGVGTVALDLKPLERLARHVTETTSHDESITVR